jgi:protein-S-isoprenylcysteine O-methyltransferase Ste14
MISRWLPLIGVVILAPVVWWRIRRQRRRYGGSAVFFLESRRWQQNLRDASSLVLAVLALAQAAMGPPPPPAVIQVVGATLLFGGIALLVVALLDLGASWRIGVDEASRPGLVTTGLYRVCRNPIFSALLVFLLGYALLLPTLLSAALVIGSFVLIRLQVVTEEQYLVKTYGDEYRAYARGVGRFVPGIGRLRD